MRQTWTGGGQKVDMSTLSRKVTRPFRVFLYFYHSRREALTSRDGKSNFDRGWTCPPFVHPEPANTVRSL